MKNIIVGTAGHVDHGKTCLIKALTGTDTDRLKEEKKRGITIELGFANLEASDEYRIGIIDVPGHEKFVKNMLAGIGGIDLVLFVVALDEGVMPQTREHFEIIKALGIKKGILVFTKKDMVEEEWAEMIVEDTREVVAGSFLENAPSIQVSAYTGENIEELRRMILEQVKDEGNRKQEAELFRLPIDRVFTMEGFGTVVTGTLLEGCISEGEEVMIYPSGNIAKVRGLQNHNSTEKTAYAGQRTAINLTGIKKEEINRGDVLARVDALPISKRMDVFLRLFDDTARALKNHDRVHVSYGSAQTVGKVVLFGKDILKAGEECFAQLIFDEEIAIRHGDKFIIRFFSPVESFGGGVILEPEARKHKAEALSGLTLLQSERMEDKVQGAILNRKGQFVGASHLGKVLGAAKEQVEASLEKLRKSKKVIAIGGDSFISKEYWEMIVQYVDKMMQEFHVVNPIAAGMEKQECKSRLGKLLYIEEGHQEAMLHELQKRGVLEIKENVVCLVGFESSYSGSLQEMNKTILQVYKNAGMNALSTEEVISGFKDKKMAKQIISNLLKDGELLRLNPSVYIKKEAYEEALGLLKETFAASEDGHLTLAQYRDRLNTSRKYAVQLLEAFDNARITKMEGDYRVLL